MTIAEFLKRLLGQVALASALLYFALLGLEKLIPGFVSPSVDLAQSGLGVLALSAAAVLVLDGISLRWRRIFSSAVFFVLFATVLFYLSTRVLELGWRGYGLLAAAAFLGCAGYYAFWSDKLAD